MTLKYAFRKTFFFLGAGDECRKNGPWYECDGNISISSLESTRNFTNSDTTFIFIVIHAALHVVWAFSGFGLILEKSSKTIKFPWVACTLIILIFSLSIAGLFTVDLVDAVNASVRKTVFLYSLTSLFFSFHNFSESDPTFRPSGNISLYLRAPGRPKKTNLHFWMF